MLVPQSSQTKYQDIVGISTLVPQYSQTHHDSVGTSTLVPQSSPAKYQDSVGISTLVPQSSQSKSKSRDLADENNNILTEWK